MDRGDAELLALSLRKAVEDHSGPSLDSALDEVGWGDALADDAAVAVSSLFELLGEANATSGALDRLLSFGLGIEQDVPIVLPALGSWEPAGRADGYMTGGTGDTGATVASGMTGVTGLGGSSLPSAKSALLLATDGSEYVAARVPVDRLRLRRVQGIDPAYGLVNVETTEPLPQMEPVDWPSARILGQLALGHQLVGASRRMLELARRHSLERVQFGRPISQFQAVRHRLAETLVAIEAAEAMLEAAWQDRTPVTAAMAKAVAGRSSRTAARHCQQVLAGIGFTLDHPLHLYVRRVMLLDQLLGSSDRLTRRLGEDLVETRRLPDLVAL